MSISRALTPLEAICIVWWLRRHGHVGTWYTSEGLVYCKNNPLVPVADVTAWARERIEEQVAVEAAKDQMTLFPTPGSTEFEPGPFNKPRPAVDARPAPRTRR